MWRAITAIVLMVGFAAAARPTQIAAPAEAANSPNARLPADARLFTVADLRPEMQSADRPWSIGRSGDVVRFEVRQGDRRQKPNERDRPIERSEISFLKRLDFGADYLIHYDFMVAPGPPNAAAWVNIGQIHSTQDPEDVDHLGPIFAVQLKGERMQIVARADPQRVSSRRPPDLWLYRDTADIVRGRWYRMDFDMRIDPFGAGRLLARRDGATLVNYAGPFGYNDAVGPYWKIGIYRATSPEPLVVSFRDFTLARLPAPAQTQASSQRAYQAARRSGD